MVAGKNLDQVGDASDVAIVLNAGLWTNAEQPEARLPLAHLVAHELAHPLIERARHASGVMDGVVIPSVTGLETATSMSRILVGEYRADQLADVVVAGYMSVTVNGEIMPAHDWMTSADARVSSVIQVIEAAHPRWPDLVQDYREHRTSLEQMYRAIQTSVDETLTALVHAQAGADSAGSDRDLVSEEPVAALPGTRLYLGDKWATFLAALRTGPQLPPLAEFRMWDDEATAVGRWAIIEIWRRLGLTILDHGNGRWGLEVASPLR